MATKKYLTKYARGGRNQNTRLDSGLRAMQIQSQTQSQALEKRKNEQKLFDASYGSGLDRAGKVAEANRKLKQKIIKRKNLKLKQKQKRKSQRRKKL